MHSFEMEYFFNLHGPMGPSCSHDVPMFDSFAAISQTKTSGAAEAIGHVLSKHRILGEFTMYLNLSNRIIARMLYHKGSSHDRTRAFEVSARPLSVALA